ncbi:hypothetical protein Pmar_PMAR027194 [Perkinsus marinus ATCC 50983]|uniref:Uncharacterized protein n=1 Tax=Perkinsus marinus (strain ATCC 50983 / TXsc) TaxID=423536 RepID=C5L803_PERM5|nr:hypothetical protein Pmar_PMAR027194 [Perkinsus marinus ATCC 50983]EER07149.1 hypothetical protein Pmar_PMAR027194 [Perkinsus marinus ATCC 50983]|eukprot:XP_002775333.1 hypothetical protein Pmar_PMAR027194 [Perkinsus marinus ATCC 50983]
MQSVAVRALTGSALDRAVGDFCVKAIRSADFPLNSWEEVGDLARCIDRLLSDEWIDLLLPPGTYTDFREKGYIEVLMKALKELKRSIDEVIEASKETGGLPAERRTRNVNPYVIP